MSLWEQLQLLKTPLLQVDNKVLFARVTSAAGANGACTGQTGQCDLSHFVCSLLAGSANAPSLLDFLAALACCFMSAVAAPAGALDGLLTLGI
jgi:hypothetical protein